MGCYGLEYHKVLFFQAQNWTERHSVVEHGKPMQSKSLSCLKLSCFHCTRTCFWSTISLYDARVSSTHKTKDNTCCSIMEARYHRHSFNKPDNECTPTRSLLRLLGSKLFSIGTNMTSKLELSDKIKLLFGKDSLL